MIDYHDVKLNPFYLDQIEEIIQKSESQLNDWESDFIDNIENRVKSNKPLSGRQAESLSEIYRKYIKNK